MFGKKYKSEKQIEKYAVFLKIHQIKSSLSSIKWSLNMLLDGDFGQLNDEQKSIIKKIYENSESLVVLSGHLLNEKHFQEEMGHYSPKKNNIEKAVKDLVYSYQEEIEKKKIVFTFKKGRGCAENFLFDAEKIKIVIQNLLDNALKYTQKGGEIVVGLEKKEEEMEFCIKDSGIGIPKNDQDKLFKEFFRGTNVLSSGKEGTGFGLYMAKKIIDLHQGKIWFESTEGKGSMFCFSLPIK